MRKRYLVEILLVFAAFYLPGYIAGTPSALGSAMAQYLLISVPQLFLLIYILWIQKDPPLSAFGFRRPKGHDWLYGFALFLLLCLLYAAIRLLIPLLPDAVEESLSQGFRWKLTDARLLPLALLFCLTTGYREEVFYRAYLLGRLGSMEVPAAPAVAASSLLFMWGHIYQGWAAVAFALLQSIVFCLFYLRVRNVHLLAVSHGLYNFLALVLTVVLPETAGM
jgi:membrane protease YdiL (CAAX protease family)